MFFSYSVSAPIKSHIYCSNFIFFNVTLAMLFSDVFSVATGVGGCWWPIPDRDVLMAVALWNFSDNPPNSDSVAYAMIFLIMLHSTCTGPFLGGFGFIGVLDFGRRKNIHQICSVPLLLIYRMHPYKYEESFRFLCILLLCLDVSLCNLKIELYVLRFWLLDWYIPPSVILVLSTLWGLLI